MSRVAVVTDSTADLAADIAVAAGIRVVPLYVQFGSEEFQAGVNLTTEQFWTRLLAPGAPFPKTAAPSPGTFKEAFEACFADGADAVVCPVIGSKLSGDVRQRVAGGPGAPGSRDPRHRHLLHVHVHRDPGPMAAEMAATGASGREIAAHVRSRLPDVDLWVAVDTLDYLRKGGRLSAAQAVIGSMLSVKPIITVVDGQVSMPTGSGRAPGLARWSSSGSPRSRSNGWRSSMRRRARPRRSRPSGTSCWPPSRAAWTEG